MQALRRSVRCRNPQTSAPVRQGRNHRWRTDSGQRIRTSRSESTRIEARGLCRVPLHVGPRRDVPRFNFGQIFERAREFLMDDDESATESQQ